MALRFLLRQRLRTLLTLGAVLGCGLLMLLLLAVHRGAREGSVGYLRATPADLWVLQKNATNILRGTSVLEAGAAARLAALPGVARAQPLLLILSGVTLGDRPSTLFVAGYEAPGGLGGPPELAAGRGVEGDDEIVLDTAFAAKHGLTEGSLLRLQDQDLRVVGRSRGTNALVLQYAFVTRRRAETLLGVPGVATCLLVQLRPGVEAGAVAAAARAELPGAAVYGHAAFVEQNVREMESGVLPLLWAVAALGVGVLAIVLALLLSLGVLEHRRDFAVLQALGAPRSSLAGVVAGQALIVAGAGALVAAAAFPALVAAIERLAPEITLLSAPGHVLVMGAAVTGSGLLALLPVLTWMRRVHPLEAFA